MRPGPQQTFIRLNEKDDVVASLELCASLAANLDRAPSFWKWMLIGAHNALYGALVCVLSGTAGVGALTPKSARKMLEYLESAKGPYPDERLADFSTLLKWGQDTKRMSYLGGHPISVTADDLRDLSQLNELRRSFVHFTPKGWSIEKSGLPRIVLAATKVVRELALEHPAMSMSLSPTQRRRLRKALKLIEQHLKQ